MRKAEPPPLARSDSLSISLRLVVIEKLDHLDAHRAGARAGNAEAIHQTRVALRRLRSVLRLFERHLDPVARDRFNDALRELGRSLGAARDWDVFVLETIPTVREAMPAASDALDTLLPPSQQQREAAHLALQATLEDPGVVDILSELRDWSALPTAFVSPGSASRSLGSTADAMLRQLARRAKRRGRKLARQDDVGRHALRKALKSLRYGVEMLQALHDCKQLKRYRGALAALQEDLGRLNDAAAAKELAGHLPDLPGRTIVTDWSHVQRRAALAGLPASWSRFRTMRPFR